MSPNISVWCTTKEGITTVPVLEGKLSEKACLVPCVTELLSEAWAQPKREAHCIGGRGRLLWLWVG